MAAASLRIVKKSPLRGVDTLWSNRYHLATHTPADYAHWETLADAVTADEKAIYQSDGIGGARIVEAVGYVGGSEVPVFTKTYNLDGTGSFSGYVPQAADVCGLVRYNTGARSTKNHPIYCFNYYHTAGSAGTFGDLDAINAAWHTALASYAAAWLAGYSDGVNTYARARPNGDAVTGYTVEAQLTHRDLPR